MVEADSHEFRVVDGADFTPEVRDFIECNFYISNCQPTRRIKKLSPIAGVLVGRDIVQLWREKLKVSYGITELVTALSFEASRADLSQ